MFLKLVICGAICYLGVLGEANAADFTDVKTVTGPGEYNFHDGESSFAGQLIDFNNKNTPATYGTCTINIENGGVLKLNSTSLWGVADVYTTNQVSGNAEAGITINGSLDISSELYMDDGRVISMMGGKNTLLVNGSVQITDSQCAYGNNVWHYGLKATNGSTITVREDYVVKSLRAESTGGSTSDKAWQAFAAGIYSDSFSGDIDDTDHHKDADAVITVGTDNTDEITLENITSVSKTGAAYTYGLLATYGNGGENNTLNRKAAVDLNGSTVIRNLNAVGKTEADVYALAAESQGVINVNGDLLIENIGDSSEGAEKYFNAVVAAGGTVNINAAGNADRKIRITGDIATYGAGSTIDLQLLNKESYFTGASSTNGGAVDLTLANGAVWRVVDRSLCGDANEDAVRSNSQISALTLDGGVVNMYNGSLTFQNLQIDKLQGGSGTFIINTDLYNKQSDCLTVTSASGAGNYKLLAYDPNVALLADQKFSQKIADAPEAGFNLASGIVEGALYNYQAQLAKSTKDGRTEWYITGLGSGEGEVVPPDLPSPDPSPDGDNTSTTVKSANSASGHMYFGWRNNTAVRQHLNKMQIAPEVPDGMGVVRNIERMLYDKIDNGGVWVQFNRGEDKGSSGGFENRYSTYAIGFDNEVETDSKGSWVLGGAFVYTEGKGLYESGSGNYRDLGFNIYGVRRSLSGHYLDLNLKVNRMKNEIDSRTLTGEHVGSKLKNAGVSMEVIYGRRTPVGDRGWYLDPQAELTLGRMNGSDYDTDNDVNVKQDGFTSLVGGVGLAVGRTFTGGGNMYVRGSILHEFCGDGSIRMTDKNGAYLTRDFDYGDTWFEAALGGSVVLGKNLHLYGEVERSFGGDVTKNWGADIGVKYIF